MGPGQEASLLQRGVDLGRRRAIGRRADGRLDVGDQVREVIVAGFREMHLVQPSWGMFGIRVKTGHKRGCPKT